MLDTQSQSKVGLVLSGGGSRAAYQVGVVRALFEIFPDIDFSIVSGFSAGAINATYLAAGWHEKKKCIEQLEHLWSNIQVSDIFRTETSNLLFNGLRFLWDLSFGGVHRHTTAQSLLNTQPLNSFLAKHISFDQIERNISSGVLESLTCSATDYSTGESVSFFQSAISHPIWVRRRRRSERVEMAVEHVLASSALPFLFPAVKVGEGYFGDGCLRNVAPLSSAIHLGADRLAIVGVRRQVEHVPSIKTPSQPGLGRVFSVILNALLLDTTDTDVERLERVNRLLSLFSEEQRLQTGLRKIDYCWLTPSVDLGELAKDFYKDLPWIVRYLLRGTGSKSDFAEISSYLLFDGRFCSRLIELGYDDCRKKDRDELRKCLLPQ